MTMNMHLTMKLIVIFYSMLLFTIEAKNCDFNIHVEQMLFNDGSHRNLTILVDFTNHETRWLYGVDCMVGIEQTLPSGVYAIIDEINNNHNKDLYKAAFRNIVDSEDPAEQAEPIIVHLLALIANYQTHIHMPVHARYHKGGPKGGMARNYIPIPKVYLLCPKQRLSICDDLYDEVSSVNNFCRDKPLEECSFKEIPIKMLTAQLTWDVPVGNTDHSFYVAVCTSVVITIFSIYLLMAISYYREAAKAFKKKK